MIKIGIISPSDIAFRRFMPALQKNGSFEYKGIAISSPSEWFGNDLLSTSSAQIEAMTNREYSKALNFKSLYGSEIFECYESLIKSKDIDAIYIPLPPALHFKWAKLSLDNGKHVFVEKPSTVSFEEISILVNLARDRNLAIHENYMFIYHNQLKAINDVVKSGVIGDVRLYRISFGFPRRATDDFRYIKLLGGGALLDAGGYTIKYARYLLGASARLVCANKQFIDDYDVEIGGNATMINDEGVCAQLAFGIDNDYKCNIEIWGSKGTITSDRIFTAPNGFEPEYILKQNQDYSTHKLLSDDAFFKSLQVFEQSVNNKNIRKAEYNVLLSQAQLVSDFIKLAE